MKCLQVRRPADAPRKVRGDATCTFEGKERLVQPSLSALRAAYGVSWPPVLTPPQ